MYQKFLLIFDFACIMNNTDAFSNCPTRAVALRAAMTLFLTFGSSQCQPLTGQLEIKEDYYILTYFYINFYFSICIFLHNSIDRLK